MHPQTHGLVGTQKLVRAFRRVAAYVARAEIAASHPVATVTTVSPLTITIDGSTVAVSATHLNSYTPTVGDRVTCDVYARQVRVLGTFT